jgi:hypothetical protein
VIDLDDAPSPRPRATWHRTPRVLLGSVRLAAIDPQCRFLEKPYRVPELIQAVEDLLRAA